MSLAGFLWTVVSVIRTSPCDLSSNTLCSGSLQTVFGVWVNQEKQTHYLPQENHILAPHDEDSSRDVAELLPHMDSLHGLMENQVGWREKGRRGYTGDAAPDARTNSREMLGIHVTELIDASQVTDQSSAVSEHHQVFLCGWHVKKKWWDRLQGLFTEHLQLNSLSMSSMRLAVPGT